jgi:diguanylate cyclase (GGDEF)-like protein/PAS domain S-box-containing protein
MIEAARPDHEAQRIQTLRRYEILDTPPERSFDRIVALATRLFNVPIALISLVEEHRQWFKASIGIDVRQTDRKLSFCAHALLGDGVMTVLDAAEDERFFDHPFVINEPKIRFYAGAPLIAPDGSKLGTLCIIDRIPHQDFTLEQRMNLTVLAETITDALELRIAGARAYVAEETARNERQLLEETFAALEEGVVLQNKDGQIVAANESSHRILGLSLDQMMGLTSLDPRWRAIHPDGSDFPGETHPVARTLSEGKAFRNVVMGIYHPDDKLVWISVNARPLFHEGESQPYAAVGSFFDITERKLKQERLEHQVNHDTLTNLPNRAAFQAMVKDATAHQQPFAIGFLDLNGFKQVNDCHGHEAGDELLKQVAQRLTQCLRGTDVVARLGGDEFTLFLPKAQSATETARIQERINATLEQPFRLSDSTTVNISISLGFSYFPDESQNADQLLKLADSRMYKAKSLISKLSKAQKLNAGHNASQLS